MEVSCTARVTIQGDSAKFDELVRQSRAMLREAHRQMFEDLGGKKKRRDTKLTAEQLAEKKSRLKRWHRRNKRK